MVSKKIRVWHFALCLFSLVMSQESRILNVGVTITLSGELAPTLLSTVVGMRLAEEYINESPVILPNLRLRLVWENGDFFLLSLPFLGFLLFLSLAFFSSSFPFPQLSPPLPFLSFLLFLLFLSLAFSSSSSPFPQLSPSILS